MRLRSWRFICWFLLWGGLWPAYAQQCAQTFSDGLTNSSDGGAILFTNYARLINNPDITLNTTRVYNNGFIATCTTADCRASGQSVPPLSGAFEVSQSSASYTVNGNSAMVNTSDYRDITVKRSGSLYFSSDFDTYRLRKLKVESYSTVYMTPGTYFIDSLELKGNAVLHVYGSGTVRIYARTQARFRDGAMINGGASGDASKLFIYYHAQGDDKLKIDSGAAVSAMLYSAGQVEVKGTSDVYGAISAFGNIQIKNDAWVTYRDTAVAETDFGGACQNGPARVDHFVIEHDGSGSTCEAERVTVKACLNAQCTELSQDSLSLDFSAAGEVKSSHTFVGSTTFEFEHTQAQSIALGLSNMSITPVNGYRCENGNGSSCQMTFSSGGCASGNTCATTFADAATNSAMSGKVSFSDWGRLIDNPDTQLQSPLVEHNGSIMYTCGSSDCRASGSVVPSLAGSFQTHSSSQTLEIDSWPVTISGNDYRAVEVKDGGQLNMSSAFSSYRFGRLSLSFLSRVNLTPGDYYIDELEVKEGSWLNVVGTGTVRLFIGSSAEFKGLSLINNGLFGDASKLFIYHHAHNGGKLVIQSAATLAGFVYSKGDVEAKSYGSIYGAVSAQGEIAVKDASVIAYRGYALDDTDFGGICDSSGSGVDHYRFEYGASALTCETQQVLIKACANADCSALYQSPATITLLAATAQPTVAQSQFTFSGSTTVSLAETAPGSVFLSLSLASPSANLVCLEDGMPDASCDYKAQDTGFIILNESDSNQMIPTQIAGKPSNVGYNAKSIAIQAVQTDTQTGACTALFADGANVEVAFAYQCEDPGSCSNNPLKILNDGNEHTLATTGAYTHAQLRFAEQSKANIALNYPDVGKIKLKVKKSIELLPGKTAELSGSSNSFVVRPFGLYVDIGANPGAQDATGGIFRRAGEKFDVSVSAVQWQNGEDNDFDGQPDSHADLSDNPLTPSFGHEQHSESVLVTSNIVSPVGGNNPPLENNRFSAFTGGRQSKTGSNGLHFDDVGVIRLSASTDGDYLGSGDNLTTTIAHVGRFVPAHFRLKNAAITPACGDFSYMAQPFNLALNLEAQGVSNNPLLNYLSDGHGLATVRLVAENGDDGRDLSGRLTQNPFSWLDGKIDTTIQPQFSRLNGAPWVDGPFDDADIGVVVDDGEPTIEIALIDGLGGGVNMNAAASGDCSSQDNCNALKLSHQSQRFRYGRVNIEAAYGPAAQPLNVPLYTEYFDGRSFVLAQADNCSTLKANELSIAGVAASPFAPSYNVVHMTDGFSVGTTSLLTSADNTTTTTMASKNGEFSLVLSPPQFNQGAQGYTPIAIDLSHYPWLQFAWSANGKGPGETTLPGQNATFGIFRGNDRVIYWRERL